MNSTALLHVLLDEGLPIDEVVFADTGAEKPETYAYMAEWILPFLAARGVPYARVAAKETLEERCLRGHTVPDRRYRWSTRDYKIRPITRHLRPHAERGVTVYIGIAFEELDRMRDGHRPWITNAYPLVDRRIDRAGCEAVLRAKGWPVPPKSGCYFCPFARISEWRDLLERHPDLWARARRIEENGSKYPEFSLVRGTLAQLEERFRREGRQLTLDAARGDCDGGYCFT